MKIILEIIKIVIVKFFEIFCFFDVDVRIVELIKFNEFVIENGNVNCGLFLLGGRFLFVNYSGDNMCFIFD